MSVRLIASLVLTATTALSGCGGGGGSGSASETGRDAAATGTDAAAGNIRPNQPRVTETNFQYIGAFRVPTGTSTETTFSYGGTALAFNPANNSLIMTGHDWHQRSAEISIPSPVNSSNVDLLPRASLIQGFADPLEGRLNQINPSDPNSKKIGGHLVYGGKLIISAYSFYDGAGTQNASHFVRPLSLSATGKVVGPIKLGNVEARWAAGYMTQIPSEWQVSFGGSALTGLAGVAIASASSVGPSAAVLDVGTLEGSAPSARSVLGYPSSNSLAALYGASDASGSNPYWNLASQVRGVVFPEGSRSVLFFGRHGTGTYCYGEGGERGQCYDPADSSKGTHAYPYRYQVWAYDANDLVDVKEGRKQRSAVQPYAVWSFSLPFEQNSAGRTIGGAAYDPATQRVFLSQQCVDTDCAPIIHVMKINK